MEKSEGNYIQKTEADVMIMNDWSLDLSNGSDIINMILKLSNEDYDFSRLMAKVNQEAIK